MPGTDRNARGRVTQFVIFGLRLAASAALLWLISDLVGFRSILSEFRIASPTAAIATLVVLMLHIGVCVWRWQLILRRLYAAEVNLRLLFLLFGLGEIAGQFLPSSIGLDLVRVASLSRSVRAEIALRSVICDRLLGLLVLIGLIVLTLPAFAVWVTTGSAFWALAGLCLAGMAGFVLALAGSDRLRSIGFIDKWLGSVFQDLRAGITRRELILPVVTLGLMIHLLSVVLIWTCGLAIGIDLGLGYCLLLAPPSFLLSALPISIGGWGLREGALAAGFSLVGLAPAGVVAASVLYGASGLVSGGFGILVGSITPLQTLPAESSKD